MVDAHLPSTVSETPPGLHSEISQLRSSLDDLFLYTTQLLRHVQASQQRGTSRLAYRPPPNTISDLTKEWEYLESVCDGIYVELESVRNILLHDIQAENETFGTTETRTEQPRDPEEEDILRRDTDLDEDKKDKIKLLRSKALGM